MKFGQLKNENRARQLLQFDSDFSECRCSEYSEFGFNNNGFNTDVVGIANRRHIVIICSGLAIVS